MATIEPPEDWEIEFVEYHLLGTPQISYIVHHLNRFYGMNTSAREVKKILEKFVGCGMFPLEFSERELKILEIIRRDFIG